jgi:hypothetical protein
VPLDPCVLGSPTTGSQGPGTQVAHTMPPWRGSIKDCHDHIFPREGHHVASARVFLEFPTMGEGLRDHEVLHHVIVFELVLDVVHVVWVGLLEESLEVVFWRPCLMLATTCGSHDVPHVGVIDFLVNVIIGHGHNPQRTPLKPLLFTLGTILGILDGDIRWCHLATSWGCYLTAWGKEKFGHLLVGGVLGSNVVQLVSGVLENVIWYPEE